MYEYEAHRPYHASIEGVEMALHGDQSGEDLEESNRSISKLCWDPSYSRIADLTGITEQRSAKGDEGSFKMLHINRERS